MLHLHGWVLMLYARCEKLNFLLMYNMKLKPQIMQNFHKINDVTFKDRRTLNVQKGLTRHSMLTISFFRDCELSSLQWKWFKWLNEHLSFLGCCRHQNHSYLSVLLSLPLYPSAFLTLLSISWINSIFLNAYTVFFSHNWRFFFILQWSNFFFVFPCIHHSSPKWLLVGILLIIDNCTFSSHQKRHPTNRKPTEQISLPEWILILMYFSLIPSRFQNKPPHQNCPNPLCGSWFANSCLSY